jgi:threonine dehydrogenase-like Zn-dependent dehydrogenase
LTKARSVVLKAPYKVVVQEFDLPQIGLHEALLRVEMVSICGSDPGLYEGKDILGTRYPLIPGHEVVGHIAAIGQEAARIYGVREGDRITVEPYVLCKNCRYCLTGYYQLCTDLTCYGMNISCADPPHLWGAYGEYMYIAPNSRVHRIEAGVPAEAACLSSVIGNGLRWISTKAQVQPGESVVIIGPGPQGLATVIAAREAGASPIIVTGLARDRMRLELAEEFGADYLVNVEEKEPVRAVAEITGGEMADVVVVCTGSPAALRVGLELLKPLGRYVIIGLDGGLETPLRTDTIVRKELKVLGGLGQAWNVEAAVKLINSRRYPVEKMVTHVFPLEGVEEALRLAREAPAGFIKAAIKP